MKRSRPGSQAFLKHRTQVVGPKAVSSVLNVCGKCSLLERMKSLLANQQTHDVKFVVKEVQIGAHASILAEASDSLKNMFYGGPTRPDVVPVEGGTPEGFRLLLSYIYTDETLLTVDNVEAVLHLAKKYRVVGLIERASKFLDVHITPANVLQYLEKADLESKCLEIIDKNGEVVLKSSAFLSLSEALLSKIISRDTLNASEIVVFDRVVAWAKAKLEKEKQPTDYPGNIRIKLGALLYQIRFPVMDAEVFEQGPRQSRIFSKEELLSLIEWYAFKKPPGRFNTQRRLIPTSDRMPISSIVSAATPGEAASATSSTASASTFSFAPIDDLSDSEDYCYDEEARELAAEAAKYAWEVDPVEALEQRVAMCKKHDTKCKYFMCPLSMCWRKGLAPECRDHPEFVLCNTCCIYSAPDNDGDI